MANLAMNTIGSLSSINQWIGLINSNITSTQKTGYKETRISLDTGEPQALGATPGTTNLPMSIPSSTLRVTKTEILDYQQGAITQTGNNTDFALQGQGYFVVEDRKSGAKYITRDGTFHFDNEGYLVTEEGLNVLTTGQDYFRIPVSERFTVDSEGKVVGVPETNSQTVLVDLNSDPTGNIFNPAAATVNARSFTTSKYGIKKLMVVQIPDSYKLHYSKYGSTKFDIGEHINVRIDNNFSEDMSALNLAQSDIINPFTNKADSTASIISNSGLNTSYFKHDLTNGIVRMSQSDSIYSKALLTTQRLTDFNASVDFNLRNNGADIIQSFGLFFGQKEQHQVAQDLIAATPIKSEITTFTNNGIPTTATNITNVPLTQATNANQVNVQRRSGFFAGITGGDTLVLTGEGISLSVPITDPDNTITGGLTYDSLNNLSSTNDYKIVLITDQDQVGVKLLRKSTAVVPPWVVQPWTEIASLGTVINRVIYADGYVGIGNGVEGAVGQTSAVDITRVHFNHNNQNNYYETLIFGGKEPYNQNPYLSAGAPTPAGTEAEPDQLQTQGQAKTVGAIVYQGSLEQSTANVTDTLPMLSNAQKLFSAISKIITVSNNQTDDMNSLIR